MRRAGIGLLLSSLGAAAGFAGAAPPVQPGVNVQARSAVPVTIESEASLEYFIATASRLLQSDHERQLALLRSQLEALKGQKHVSIQKIVDVESRIAGAESAHDAALVAKLGVQLDGLKTQLASIDVTIKNVIQQIHRLQEEEQREQDDIKRAEEAFQRFDQALDKAASNFTAIVGAMSMNTFVRGLSAEKRRQTQNKVRRALAQLAEARRMRLQLSTSDPLRPVPKPLTTK